MQTDNRYSLLRNQLDVQLEAAQHTGVPFDRAMGDLIRLALVLSVATQGPRRTEDLITKQLEHMRRVLPGLHDADRQFPDVQGSA